VANETTHIDATKEAKGDDAMPKLGIIATIEAIPGRMNELLPLLMQHRERCLKDEPGTLQFDFLLPRDDETKVLLIEVYEDEDAFKAHWSGPSMATYKEQSAGMVAKMTGTRGAIAE
jgi:(4S)-4-hydroxy-5-phosphonooxypentane-2,3-dione isomerase